MRLIFHEIPCFLDRWLADLGVLGDQLRTESAFLISAVCVNMIFSHYSVFGILVKRKALLSFNRKFTCRKGLRLQVVSVFTKNISLINLFLDDIIIITTRHQLRCICSIVTNRVPKSWSSTSLTFHSFLKALELPVAIIKQIAFIDLVRAPNMVKLLTNYWHDLTIWFKV